MGKQNTQSKQHSRRLKVEDQQGLNLPIIKQIRGEFRCDLPSHISSHILVGQRSEIINSKLENYMFRLEWKQRADGVNPVGTEFKYNDLKQVCPGLLMKYLSKFIVLS
ncbi:unnamed protein product [Paramecium octaurelia]|uniref:Uncharacterized protein n=1 Tax=Paramecium octaurelia TaxID=43137 RepID=A0A8S1S372_PAROT|nr:unnamed protein product [Paramecium octaurelia]CAD8135865.1 unnamed protein product [Paramecium octaurelia]